MIAFDSNILIYTLRENPSFQQEARAIFEEIERHGGVCSTLVITETLYGELTSIQQIPLLNSSYIKVMPVDAGIAEKAGQLRIAYGLKNIDAMHIATAILAGAETFVTNDLQLLKTKIPKLVIRGL